jgi:hypothetical protein
MLTHAEIVCGEVYGARVPCRGAASCSAEWAVQRGADNPYSYQTETHNDVDNGTATDFGG